MLLLSATVFADGVGQSIAQGLNETAPGTFCLNGRNLLETRHRIAAGDKDAVAAFEKLKRAADVALREPLRAVTDKPFPAPSGDKHDYVSLSTYFWPNPATTNGLPYVQRDGETNPEIKQYDSGRLKGMSDTVKLLALAYYLTGQVTYAERAAGQIRRWFLDKETRMNPHLKYGQLVKGINEGSRWGIIDTAILIWVVDADAILQGSSAWSPDDHRQLQKWFADYLVWLRTSDLGHVEAAALNNHGSYYDLQVADFALFTGEQQLAREVLENAKLQRIARQIEPDGSQPFELARTKSYEYTLVNLNALFCLASVGDRAGVDLWNYRTPDGRSLRGALDWVIPFATGKQAWTHQQIIPHPSNSAMVSLLRQAAMAYHEPAYQKIISQVKGRGDENSLANLFYPLPKS